jgi:uncharacterized membrane protein YgcG
MSGATLLWRDASTLALALLLWGRGFDALLEWQGGNGGHSGPPAIVTAATFDPRGARPLRLAPTRISLADLSEVNALRAELSAQLGTPRLGATVATAVGDATPRPLLSRILRLLRLDASVHTPEPRAPPASDPRCGAHVSDHADDGGMEELLPRLSVSGLDDVEEGEEEDEEEYTEEELDAAEDEDGWVDRGALPRFAFAFPAAGSAAGPRLESMMARPSRPVGGASAGAGGGGGGGRAGGGGGRGGAAGAFVWLLAALMGRACRRHTGSSVWPLCPMCALWLMVM